MIINAIRVMNDEALVKNAKSCCIKNDRTGNCWTKSDGEESDRSTMKQIWWFKLWFLHFQYAYLVEMCIKNII